MVKYSIILVQDKLEFFFTETAVSIGVVGAILICGAIKIIRVLNLGNFRY